ncbi:MAG: S-layer homology domain-containing protein, partial [Firmicutes bacterium]|nr:S-layer homology domain-containing protein [Bacillota bacterium]
NCTCNPKHDAELTKDIDSVLFVYTYIDPETKLENSVKASLPITVTAKPEEAKEIKKIQLLSSNGAKRDYFIGEAFDPEGFEFLLVYSDASTDVKDLSDYKSGLTVDSNKYNNSSKQFTAALDGDLKVNFSITYSGTKYNVSLTIPNITVTKRPVLESISVNADKVDYLEGEAPQVKDFVITAKYDDKSQRVFEVADDVTGANRTTYSTTTGGVTYTVKLTPTMVEGDTTKIRVTYSEKVSNTAAVSKYADVEIDVTIPDAILTYYDTTERTYITKAYEDLLDALDKAEEIADSYGSTYASRIPELELRRDVTMVSDFPTTESLNIDLNGHVLTMIRGEIYVSSRASTGVEVVFSNSDKADAKLVYSSDEDDTVIIAYNDTYTIDKSTTNAGKYEVVISAVKNGKVTGPDEVTHGHDAQFTITPNEDYEIATIKVNNKTQSIPTDGKLIVENVQAKLTVTVTFKEKAWDNPFTDVYKSATYYKSVQFVYENGLFNGTSATKFEPDTTMTRAMFVT